jgi:hypothetical protein
VENLVDELNSSRANGGGNGGRNGNGDGGAGGGEEESKGEKDFFQGSFMVMKT